MADAQLHEAEYDDTAIRFLGALWGDGYLSPGGPEERASTWSAMQKVLDSGEHRPTHLRGRKPE